MIRNLILAAAFAACANLVQAQATADVNVTWTDDGGSAYFISSQSTPIGTVSIPNPAVTLQMGKRYRWTVTGFGGHPMQLISNPGPGAFAMLLAQTTFATGDLEADAGISWLDSGGADIYFTMTGKLGDALRLGGNTPLYQCQVHPGSMEGTISFSPAASPLQWSSGTESFENVLLNNQVAPAITGWTIVDAATASQYTAEITTTPTAHLNQAPGSTRWLTITDAEDSAAANGRTYSNTVTAAGTAGRYVFSQRIDAQSIGAAAKVLVVTQHNDGGTFKNLAGLEITNTGVNAIILGTADGGVGISGASVRSLLYNFADAGGFGLNAWVPVQFDVNMDAGTVTASATGTNGTTNKSTMLTGLALQGATDRNTFRYCIRGNGTGNTSVISYDNIGVQGFATSSAVDTWNIYE